MGNSLLSFFSFAFIILPSIVTAAPLPIRSNSINHAEISYFDQEYVYPTKESFATKSTYGPKREISAWRDLLIFYGLLIQHPELNKRIFNDTSAEELLILAPTNQAFLEFFEQVKEFGYVGLPVLDNLSFIAGLSPHLKRILMDLIETHVVSGNWQESKIVEAQTLKPISGVELDTSTFPDIVVASTGLQSRRMYRQILTTEGPVRRLCFIDTVLVPPSIHDLLMTVDNDDELPTTLSFPEEQTHKPQVMQVTGNVLWDNMRIDDRQYQNSDNSPMNVYASDKCRFSNCSKRLQSTLKYGLKSIPFIGRNIFHSMQSLLIARTDCNIFSALVQHLPGVMDEIEKQESPVHALVPTDKSLMDFYLSVTDADNELPSMEDITAFINGHVDMISSMLSDGLGVPNILDAVLFHFCVGAEKPIHRLSGQALQTLSGGIVRVSADGMSVHNSGYPDDASTTVASYATLNGFVTPISGVLTKFDANLATLIGMLVLRGSESAKRYSVGKGGFYSDLHGNVTETPATLLYEEAEETMEPPLPSVSTAACFPGDAFLTRPDGTNISMKDINAGDSIQVSPFDHSSKIFAFTHRERSGAHPYVEISFPNGMSLTLSENHYTYADGRLVSAGEVQLGQKMTSGTGETLTVWDVRRVWKTGRYAPHSIHGDLVVNGVVVSAYTTEVHPSLAHALLAPVRLFSYVSGVQEPLGSIFYRGSAQLSKWVPSGRPAY